MKYNNDDVQSLQAELVKRYNKDFYYKNAINKSRYSTAIYIILGALSLGIPCLIAVCLASNFVAVKSIWGISFLPSLLVGGICGWFAKKIDISLYKSKIKKNSQRINEIMAILKSKNIEPLANTNNAPTKY